MARRDRSSVAAIAIVVTIPSITTVVSAASIVTVSTVVSIPTVVAVAPVIPVPAVAAVVAIPSLVPTGFATLLFELAALFFKFATFAFLVAAGAFFVASTDFFVATAHRLVVAAHAFFVSFLTIAFFKVTAPFVARVAAVVVVIVTAVPSTVAIVLFHVVAKLCVGDVAKNAAQRTFIRGKRRDRSRQKGREKDSTIQHRDTPFRPEDTNDSLYSLPWSMIPHRNASCGNNVLYENEHELVSIFRTG